MWYFSNRFAHFPHLEEWNTCIEYSINSIHSYRIFILRIWALSSLVVTGKMWILQVLFPIKWCVSQWLKHCWCECLKTEAETIGTWGVSVVQPVQMQTLWKENCFALLQNFLTTHTWQFTWLFFLHAHRMDRTRVLLRWYQAWGSKEDKVVWALTTKDLVLIKVIKYIVCSPVSQSPQRGAVPVQCTQTEMAGAQCRALAERKASIDVGWNVQEKFSQKYCLMRNVSHTLCRTVWTRAS